MLFAKTLKTTFLGLAFASIAWNAPYGYSISDANQNLYVIDLATGLATSLGVVPYEAADEIEGLAAIGNTLLGVSEANYGQGTLWNLNSKTQIGLTGDRLGTEAGAAYGNGSLYNLQADELSTGNKSWLYTINPLTGLAAFVGASPIYADGLAINAAGIAYAADFRITDSLYTVDLLSGALTLVGALNLGDVNQDAGLAFTPDGALWAIAENGELYQVDTATGQAAFQSFVTLADGTRVPGDLEGFEILASAIPEPGSIALLGSGLLGLALFGRRLRRRR